MYSYLFMLVCLFWLSAASKPAKYETDDIYETVTSRVAKHPEIVLDYIEDKVSVEGADELEYLLIDNDPYYDPASCASCLLMWGAARTLVNENVTFEDAREEVVEICLNFLNDSYVREDVLCQGLVDNYGPHVFYITENTEREPRDICVDFNNCRPDDGEVTTEEPYFEDTDSSIDQEEVWETLQNMREEKLRRKLSDDEIAIKRQNAVKVVHLTDIHVDQEYLEGTATDCGLPVCCNPAYGEGDAGLWGSFACNAPPRTTEFILEQVANMNPEPDFIIYSGDNPPHTQWDESLEKQLGSTIWLADTMERILGNSMEVYPAIGNHEMYPANLYYIPNPDTVAFNEAFINAWQPLAKFTAIQRATIEQGGWYSMRLRNGLKLVVYNSNYGYAFNWYNILNEDRPEPGLMRQFLEDELGEAELEGDKVVLVGHHPLGGGDSMIDNARFITDLTLRFADTIVCHLHGHTHSDEFRLVIDPNDGLAKTMQLVAGTANPRTNNNPQARVLYLDADTFELLDYEHHIMDIMRFTDDPNPEMELLYRASETYDIPDMTPASWQELTFRFENSTDSTLFDTWYGNRNGGSGQSGRCAGICKRNQLCRIRNTVYDAYRECTARN